ncbi:hypothetical protein NQ318_019434 [Aromia moschata]|uniref:Zinc carboxypeptidase A 1 n=1 Tax=Aromia moschata TaxID=1265417 RepID=A0AAV8XYE9_9CUCU|nr:hypothetical protein NQ318_019434 [Aromia moschata]
MRLHAAVALAHLLFVAVLCEKVRYDDYKVYKVTPQSAEAIITLKGLENAAATSYNFWSPVGSIGVPVDIMVSPDHEAQLLGMVEALGMDSRVMMDNVQRYIDEESRPRVAREDEWGWERYQTLEEINVWLRTLTIIYPQTVTLIEGGITSAVVTYILNELVTSQNATIRALAESHDWYVFPVFNPDGFEYSHTTDRMWRKTRVPHSILCFGADPNRNWDFQWSVAGTSFSPCTEIYHGPQPFSEPSCRSMAQFITGVADQLVAYLSFHSFSQMMLIPYGHTSEHLDNYDLIYEVGRRSAEALASRYGTQYRVGTVYEVIYPASGSSCDWVKGTFNTSIVYTYELRDLGEYGFLLPPEQIIPTALETLDSFITIFEEYYNLTGQ